MKGLWLLAALVALAAASEAAAHARARNMWTAEQAESIRLVRGTRVRVRRCDGFGPNRLVRRKVGPGAYAIEAVVYRHFACRATTGFAGVAPVDTVTVTYVLHPLGRYAGRRSAYVTTNVRFEGFGVP